MKLHAVKHDPALYRNRYCGPAAFSAITGKPAEHGARLMRQISGRPAIKGVHHLDLRESLFQMGYRTKSRAMVKRPTLARFLRERTGELTTAMLLIELSSHYIVVKGRKAVDNFTEEPKFIRKFPHRRARVVRYSIVEKR